MQENRPEKPNVFVVLNPVAGTSDPAAVRAEIENCLLSDGRTYQIYETTGKENIRDVVRDALRDGFQLVWAAGGDGTVSAVANALVKGQVPMGILPLGTGNVLSKELGIPQDLTAACDLLTGDHRTRVLDVLRVNEAHFVLSVSAGISSFLMAATAREQKRRLGQLAYILNGARIILSRSIWPFRVSVDGQPLLVRASEVMVANVGGIGYKQIRWGDQVQPDDGRVDLCRVRVDSVSRLLAVLGGLLFSQQEHLQELTCNAASHFIEIQSRWSLPVQGDGEHIGFTPVRIEVIPQSLPVIVPALEV